LSKFPNKQFDGALYTFAHLSPISTNIEAGEEKELIVNLKIRFGCHCFTEKFNTATHDESHKYFYKNELRAFSTKRYACSLQLPTVVKDMMHGRIYQVQQSFVYTTSLNVGLASKEYEPYSIFFNLRKTQHATVPSANLFIKSAYLRSCPASNSSRAWRFSTLACQVTGIFDTHYRE
jgi:hypothetical protein